MSFSECEIISCIGPFLFAPVGMEFVSFIVSDNNSFLSLKIYINALHGLQLGMIFEVCGF